jgi:hypothetical protein
MSSGGQFFMLPDSIAAPGLCPANNIASDQWRPNTLQPKASAAWTSALIHFIALLDELRSRLYPHPALMFVFKVSGTMIYSAVAGSIDDQCALPETEPEGAG